MNPENEEDLISDLFNIKSNSFRTKTENFDDFDKDSLVLRLFHSNELLNLHNKILDVVKNYADSDFSDIERKYFGNNYNPHLTISKSSSNFDRNSKELFNQTISVQNYYLSRKKENIWEEIQ
jgi:2'-5' RNA ligase